MPDPTSLDKLIQTYTKDRQLTTQERLEIGL